MARHASHADQLDLGSPRPLGGTGETIAGGGQAGPARPDVPRGPVVLDPYWLAVAGFAGGVRRLERRVPTVQALAVGRGFRPAVRRLAARAPGAGHLPAVRRL